MKMKLLPKILAAASAVILMACSETVPTDEASSKIESNDGTKMTAIVPAVAVIVPDVLHGELSVDFRQSPERMISNAGIEATASATGVRVSGTKATANSGSRTGGAYLKIGSDFEQAFGGRTIKVSILARSFDKGGVKIAYSTADKGNSGWWSFDLTSEFGLYEFEYNVPPVVQGRNDFVGVLPVTSDVELKSVSVNILD